MSNKGFKDYLKKVEENKQLSEWAVPKPMPRPSPRPSPRPRPKPAEPKPMPDQPKPGEAPTRPEKEVPGQPIPQQPKPMPDQPRPGEAPTRPEKEVPGQPIPPKPVPEPKPVPDQTPGPKPEPRPETKPQPSPLPIPIPHKPEPKLEPELGPETKPQPSPIPVPPGKTEPGKTNPTPVAPFPIPIDQEQGKKLDFWRWGRAPADEPVGPYRSDKEMGYVKEFKNMTDIQKSLYIIETMSTAEKHPTGPKFPGYWKGTDPASAAKDRMVGGSEEQQESVLGELDKTAKDTAIQRRLQEKYNKFKEDNVAAEPTTTTADQMVPGKPGWNKGVETKPIEGPGGTPFGIYPKAFPKREPSPVYKGTDTDPSNILGLIPGRIGVAGALGTYSGELNKGEDEALQQMRQKAGIPEPAPATKSDHLAAIRQADADAAARQQSAPAASKTVPKAPATASGPLIRPDDESAAEKARLQRPSVNAPVSTPEPQKVAPTVSEPAVSEPAGSAAKTQPNVQPAAPAADNAPAAALKPTTYQELQKLNPFIKDANKIYVGQQITAPNGDIYTVQKGDTLSKIAANWNQQMGFTTAPVKPPAPPATSQAGSSAKIQPVPPNAVRTQYGDIWRDSQGNPITSGTPLDKESYKAAVAPNEGGRLGHNASFVGKDAQGNPYITPEQWSQKTLGQQKSITDMTMDEIRQFQQARGGQANAVGKYGFIGSTFDDLAKKLQIPGDQKFDAATQEAMQNQLIDDQIKFFNRQNIPVTPATLYSSHRVGSGGTSAIIQAAQQDPNRTVADVLATIGPNGAQPGTDKHEQRMKYLLKNNPDLSQPTGNWLNHMDKKVASASKPTQVGESRFDKKVADRYSYDEFDDMIDRLRAKAKEQEKKHGPVDLAKLMKRLRDIDDKDDKPIKEEEPPNLATNPNMQATNAARQATNPAQQDTQAGQQATSQAGTVQQQQQRRDQALDTSTARGVADTIASVAPPGTNPDALAQGIVNANDGKPLSMDQQKAMSTITPLVLKAAETPVAAGALKTALQQAGVLAKQGK